MRNKFFKKASSFTVSALSKIANSKIVGDEALMVSDVGTLEDAQKDHVTFFNNEQYASQLRSTKAGVCIIKETNAHLVPEGAVLLINENPYAAWAKILAAFYPDESAEPYISPDAKIHPSAKIGEQCTIEAGVIISREAQIGEKCVIKANSYIGERVVIGSGTLIQPHCFIICCEIGQNCVIYPGVKIGQDGFGFAMEGYNILKVKQIGWVSIGNNVEIGAGTCIDRGAISNTVIGDNVKIDNLVQIGHNVVVGKNCVIVAQAGIAGSSKLGDGVMLGGQAGIAGHLSVGPGAMVAAQSGVITNIKANEVVGGSPAVNIRQWHKQSIFLKKMTTN